MRTYIYIHVVPFAKSDVDSCAINNIFAGEKNTLKRILKQISRSCNDSMSISLVPILGQYSLDIHIITHNPKLTRMLF